MKKVLNSSRRPRNMRSKKPRWRTIGTVKQVGNLAFEIYDKEGYVYPIGSAVAVGIASLTKRVNFAIVSI